MKFTILFLIITVFSTVGLAAAQTAANADPAGDVKFQISFADGKSVYRIGEPVKLLLSYTADQPGYAVERYYSPRFDDVIVSPAEGIYPWLYRLNRLYSYDDVSMPQALSQSPVNIEITVNNLLRFDTPGHYKVKVLSRRAAILGKVSSRDRRPALLSNELEFEIKEMSQEEEEAEVKRITTLMDSATTLPKYQAIKQELDFLTGDVSTAEKIRRFLKPPVFGGVSWLDSGKGLNIARNKKLAIELLEKAFRDPNREINEDLIREMVTLRLLAEDELEPSQATTSQQLWKEREARSSELTGGYNAELLASLRQRSGRTQIVTAFRIFTSLPKDDTSSAAFAVTKPLLMEKFDDLKHYEQSTLLDRFWDKIKTPALIPSLIKILSHEEPSPVWNNRVNALKRLIELDQKSARPFVIEEIKKFNSNVSVDILASLNDKFLPEADAALLENIRQAAPLKVKNRDYQILYTKSLLAARYGTKNIYRDLMKIYRTWESGWLEDSRDALIGYFVRHNANEGIALIEEREKKLGDEADSNIFYGITKMNFPPGLEKFLRKRLNTDNPSAVGNAAYLLAKYGGRENRKLIEKRHARWIADWSARRMELDDPKTAPDIRIQSMVQINIIESLINAKSWKLSETEIKQLKLMCVTRACREWFSIRYLTKEK